MKRDKITIVGAGNVGASAANWIVSKELGDVVLVDIVKGVPQGKALDLAEATPIMGVDAKITGTNNYEDTKDSDVVVITAGVPRKEGMSRDDLVKVNSKIVASVVKEVVKHSPNSILILVSNPLDAMVYTAFKISGFPKERVVGMAGTLDSTRFRYFVAAELGVSVNDVEAAVLGGHGDTMIPMERLAKVKGVPLTESLSKEKLDSIIDRTRKGGGEFLPLLNTSAWVAPGMAICEMVEAIVKDKKKTLPCAAYLDGEYGVKDLFIGVVAVLGRNGVEEVVELELNEEEKKQFDETVGHVKSIISAIDWNEIK
ncbi:MAG: malate dehydrogenase [Nanoarchaeota archaeon]